MNREPERKRLVGLLDECCKKELGSQFYKSVLGRIADHLLDNGVVAPPCKVGQTVYIITEISQTIVEADIIGVWQCKDTTTIITNHGTIHQNSIGKTVFTSREDAVKALGGDEK